LQQIGHNGGSSCVVFSRTGESSHQARSSRLGDFIGGSSAVKDCKLFLLFRSPKTRFLTKSINFFDRFVNKSHLFKSGGEIDLQMSEMVKILYNN
jgi:uncharacterized C2H2 Zn-finger protein